jgi:crotonobetainyl-CoA:carnitine CoA-transferase CaiB-like acyl-CoA transferase
MWSTSVTDELASLVEDRSRAAVKRILSLKERIADPHLEKRDQERLRAVVVDEIGELTRLSSTLLRSLSGQLVDGYAMNQMWLEQIAQSLGVELEEVEGARTV